MFCLLLAPTAELRPSLGAGVQHQPRPGPGASPGGGRLRGEPQALQLHGGDVAHRNHHAGAGEPRDQARAHGDGGHGDRRRQHLQLARHLRRVRLPVARRPQVREMDSKY